MVVFEATFKKNDGTKRKMRFARLSDLPSKQRNRVAARRRNTDIPDGMELVWDVQKRGYRWFNWNAVVGKVTANRA